MKFSDFDVKQKLGFGSFGVVYKVMRKDTGETFALKVQNKKKLKENSKKYKVDMIEYVLNEVAIMKDLKKLDFQLTVELVSTFQTKDNLYMVLEYCENGNLHEFLCFWYKSNSQLDE